MPHKHKARQTIEEGQKNNPVTLYGCMVNIEAFLDSQENLQIK